MNAPPAPPRHRPQQAELVFVRCPAPKCGTILGQRRIDWRGDPEWIKCRSCRQMLLVDGLGAKVVPEAGVRF